MSHPLVALVYERRRALGMSTRDLSIRSGIAHSTIIELRRQTRPTIMVVESLLGAMGMRLVAVTVERPRGAPRDFATAAIDENGYVDFSKTQPTPGDNQDMGLAVEAIEKEGA